MSEDVPATEQAEPATERAVQHAFVLKEGDTYFVMDAHGDVGGGVDGLFHNDTRMLSTFVLRLNGARPSLLSSGVSQDNVFFTANLTNHPLPVLGSTSMPQGVIHLERKRFLWGARLFERLRLVNYSDQPAEAPLTLQFGADFRDMFEVRGQQRARRGEFDAPEVGVQAVELRYEGLDTVLRRACIGFSQVPRHLDAGTASFSVPLAAHGEWTLHIEVGMEPARPGPERFRDAGVLARWRMRARQRRGSRLESSGRLFQAWLDRSRADLALLTTDLPTGPYPYAGIPWFSTPFGRDAIVTAFQTLWIDPRLAQGVLEFLAARQSRQTSSFRDAEPGKIMHETRKGEMAAVDELPFGQYYGGVDTTPLFVALAGAYAQRTADHATIDRIWPALLAACEWMERNMARHPDGLLAYQRGETSGLVNQGWKDSHDSIFHVDGRTPEGPIALVEVQGYVYAAFLAMASIAEWRVDSGAAHWRQRAAAMRVAVENRFWLDDLQFYALAIDGSNQPCRVRASNAGHLLFTGLPIVERAVAVGRQLLSPAFASGWGIRTLPIEAVRFNPMSYHNGSVWPHDAALCAAGMARYGEREGVVRILDNLFESAAHFGMRLPELFCGFDRQPGQSPIAYPVACLPQAWAAGSAFMLLQACLGLQVDGIRRQVTIVHPRLPADIDHLHVRHLRVGDARVDLHFQRLEDRIVVVAQSSPGGPRVAVNLQL
ncbi:glycogen debranching enzyme [Variovorax paradoxus]|uniref:amylo-alpha-1,6-glucosidase n=1 Tax=Variovorax paradoxus TaxID=34073 RepID=UPI00277E0065|nr:amylo-alpha-1,6-glucosidase [Variovorax paradoxus]MDP9928569.1 glycogen debranching enzyme [Variovorax paradoxus]MDQ0023909.1 glycogen debranching enzyme [Variovorax paradoxus]